MDLTTLFCNVDDFVKENASFLSKKLISESQTKKRHYTPGSFQESCRVM